MYLYIDTSVQEYIRVGLFEAGKLKHKKSEHVGYHYSEKILSVVDSILKSVLDISSLRRAGPRRSSRHERHPMLRSEIYQNLYGIIVVSGPGRFSALRTGVTVANTLAWAADLPVRGLRGLESLGSLQEKEYWAAAEELISKDIKDLDDQKKFGSFVVPEYGQEPNITLKKAG